ncbi:beta-ketoacyl-[acyl-carrier-protein] synthase family protein [candidate division KSB1 bacterium]|nr:beta-ketoacyl-[acyl-carrier-protein] synthase family protein [candidate division KSB1 bacterium]NIR69348.1 beta-ketoacyl-[acyl-carrier-protein] synthase family protein [candidate division KSB1 bacterium]NIS24166.1 beta-ketoacyl-[acyl-carrier-protein] synthase family protein [candidate division KSB1 bacterium]NIT71081.1 beta-ketoacyl-[acyl-carrier-protein] synthase family protein [candidate division KSB1 bacterium]NIU24785.1 beta-ketoacyl-[acyl-carrier-protein] synthase family protein [candid
MNKRIVITGLGAITSLGIGIEETWNNYLAGRSGINVVHSFVPTHSTILAGRIAHNNSFTHYLSEDKINQVDRFTTLMMIASRIALNDSKIDVEDESENIGVYIGSGFGGTQTVDEQNRVLYAKGPKKVHPRLMQNNITNAASGEVAIELGLRGANVAFSTGFCSGAYAITQAFNALQLSDLVAILAGGTDAPILPTIFNSLSNSGKLSTRTDLPLEACRPFDKERDGFVLGEGAGAIVLETLDHASERGAHIYAELVGFAMTYNTNYHKMTLRNKVGGMAKTMRLALKDAEVEPSEINYINAYGIGTQEDDLAETNAIKEVFGKRAAKLMVSSSKSALGYAIAASDVVEACLCCLAIEHGIVPPTLNYEVPNGKCDLDYVPTKPRRKQLNAVLSNTFGLDGNFVSLVFRKFVH